MTTPDPEVSSGDEPKRAGYAPGSLKAISERGQQKARERQQKEREAERSDATEDLADRHAAGQLVLWPESQRGIPYAAGDPILKEPLEAGIVPTIGGSWRRWKIL